MKKFLLVIGLIATLFTITACNSKENLNNNIQGGTSENGNQNKPINEIPNLLAGVYTAEGELYQLPMGTNESDETKHLIDFTAPLDTFSFCSYFDENFKGHSFNARGDTLRSAINNGMLEEGYAVTTFSDTDIYAYMYSSAESINLYGEYDNLFDNTVKLRNDSYDLDIEQFGEDYLKVFVSENLNTPTRAYWWVLHHKHSSQQSLKRKINITVLVEIDANHIIEIICDDSQILDVIDEDQFVNFAKNLYNLVTIK